MSSNAAVMDSMQTTVRAESKKASAVSWGLVVLGVLWIGFGMFVLSYRVGSLAAVAGLAGVALLAGGVSQLVLAVRATQFRWLFILAGILGLGAGVAALVWPGVTLYVLSVLVAWTLVAFGVFHIVSSFAGIILPLWWTQLLLGLAELALGIWTIRSWEHSLVTLVALVGSWAVIVGVTQISGAFSLRFAAKRTERLAE